MNIRVILLNLLLFLSVSESFEQLKKFGFDNNDAYFFSTIKK